MQGVNITKRLKAAKAYLVAKARANAAAAATLIGILVFVVLFYLTVIVRDNFKDAIDTSTLDNSSQTLINNVDQSTNSGLNLAGIGPVVIAAVFILSLILGLVAFANRMG